MGTSYRECPACGKRALSIATRCPACGQEILGQPVRRPTSRDPGRLFPLLGIAAILLAAGGLATWLIRGGGSPGPEVTATAVVPAEAPAALDTARAAASPAVPDSMPSAEATPRFARTWTKVHARRSVKADLVAVLLPGDTVLADSLKGGWWRVALDGRVLGYVYASTLAADSTAPFAAR